MFKAAFGTLWVLGVLGSLTFWVVVIWAIIKMVNHFA